MKIETGLKAPEFSLYNSEKTKVSLSDYKGKNVLLQYKQIMYLNKKWILKLNSI